MNLASSIAPVAAASRACWANSPLTIPTDTTAVRRDRLLRHTMIQTRQVTEKKRIKTTITASGIAPNASAFGTCRANSLSDALISNFDIRATLDWASVIVPVATASRSCRANSRPILVLRVHATKKVSMAAVCLFPTLIKKTAHFAMTIPTAAKTLLAHELMLDGRIIASTPKKITTCHKGHDTYTCIGSRINFAFGCSFCRDSFFAWDVILVFFSSFTALFDHFSFDAVRASAVFAFRQEQASPLFSPAVIIKTTGIPLRKNKMVVIEGAGIPLRNDILAGGGA